MKLLVGQRKMGSPLKLIFIVPTGPCRPGFDSAGSRVAQQAFKITQTLKQQAMSKTNAAPLSTEPAHYEAALQELEKLVLELEGGQMPLDQLLAGYQRGAQLLAYCRDKLAAVEQQIKVLDGGELKPWAQE